MKNEEIKTDKVIPKRLIVDMPQSLHHEIKTQASWRNMSIKKYIIETIIERIKKDAKYQ